MATQKIRKIKPPARLLILFCLGIVQCGTVASVQPLGKGNSAITFSSGGPVTTIFGMKMPIPYTVLRYRKGLNENTDFHFGIHPTLMIMGNMSLDIGITKHILSPSGFKPGLSAGTSIYGFYHMNKLSTARVFPELSVIGSYPLFNQDQWLYFGLQSMFQYIKPYAALVPLVGFEFHPGKRFMFNLETKWYAPTEESANRVVDYEIRPFDQGAVGFVWGISYRF